MTVRRTLAAGLAAQAQHREELREAYASQHPRKSPSVVAPMSPGHWRESENATPLPHAAAPVAADGDDYLDRAAVGLAIVGMLAVLGGSLALNNLRLTPRPRVDA